MLRKFVTIRNVGRFKNLTAQGDVELKHHSLLYAENGRGKTTLCAILRSVQSGEAAHVVGRTTLGDTDAPEVELLGNGTVFKFTDGAWNATVPEIAIFDATFVSENIFSGDVVDIAHRRNLYRVIVGREGVALAMRVEQLDSASRIKAAEIRTKAAPLQALVPEDSTLEAFLAIAEDPGIDEKIAAAEAELQALREAERIRSRIGLTALTIPVLPPGFAELLTETVDGIAGDAERRVNAQVEAHTMHGQGQTWLSEGVGYIRNDTCPFCNQSLVSAADLMGAYRAFFSQGYRRLRTSIATMQVSVEIALGDRRIASIERILDQNNAGVDFWSRFCEIASPVAPEDLGRKLRALRSVALNLLARKAAAPLDGIALSDAFRAANAGAEALAAAEDAYNEVVATANRVIAARQAATGATDAGTVAATLAKLRLSKKRHEPGTKAACRAYQACVVEKSRIEEQKAATKEELDQYTATVLEKYARAVNRILDGFHSGFNIANAEHGYPGGVASSSYQILINGTPVELGDDRTPLDRPSFRNTLSSGDRSTLALAFFLAQLEQDPGKTEKIVVFDDPFNSQDAFRKDHTVRKICDTGEMCAQVIVLSHDVGFLKRIWDRLRGDAAERKCLELKRIGLQNTSIVEWGIEAAVQSAYKADHCALTDYYHDGTGELREIVQKIRPVLETYTKILGRGIIAEVDTLGVIVGKIRTAGRDHPLYPICDELDDLNIYTRRYHHGENPQAATEPIVDGELHGFVGRALEMTGGCSNGMG